ncbi:MULTISPECIES: hypothetical protein [Photobacterium]|nr:MULTISPECIES: hypothetical protein [Photobacterium]UIP29311.1 hypothetical protein LN341_07610 [Photobacterium sp. TLY01]
MKVGAGKALGSINGVWQEDWQCCKQVACSGVSWQALRFVWFTSEAAALPGQQSIVIIMAGQ